MALRCFGCLLRLCSSSAAGPCQIKDFFAAFESSPLNYSYIVEQEDRWAVETEAVRTLGHNLRKRQTLNFDIRLRCPFTSFTCAADGGRKSMRAVGMDETYVRWHTKTYWSCYKSKFDKDKIWIDMIQWVCPWFVIVSFAQCQGTPGFLRSGCLCLESLQPELLRQVRDTGNPIVIEFQSMHIYHLYVMYIYTYHVYIYMCIIYICMHHSNI